MTNKQADEDGKGMAEWPIRLVAVGSVTWCICRRCRVPGVLRRPADFSRVKPRPHVYRLYLRDRARRRKARSGWA